MAEIVLEEVTKRYPDGALAVDRFSLTVADGELVVLVGPSGCGKSTLLNLVAGLEEITGGRLLIDGEVVNDRPPRERDIAMVFQSYALYPHLTVAGNLGFPLRIAGLDRSAIRARVQEVAEMLELTPHLDRRPALLSGGQRQRVAMGRAMVRRPRAFLMDEPLSNLDARLRVEMRRQVAHLQKELGTTTLYVTHDQTEAMTLGERVVVMRRGVLQQAGPPRLLYDAPANLFVAGFIGSPPMSFLPARLDGETLRSPLGEVPLPQRLRAAARERGGELVLGIRPENFLIAAGAGDRPGGRVRARIDAVESLGADRFAYFSVPGELPDAEALRELAVEAGSARGGIQVAARLDAEVGQGEVVELWYDPERIHLFDARSGASLAEALARE